MKNTYLGFIFISIGVLGYIVFGIVSAGSGTEVGQNVGIAKQKSRHAGDSSLPKKMKVKATIEADSEAIVGSIVPGVADRSVKIKNSIRVFKGLLESSKKAHFKSVQRNVFAKMAEDPEYILIAQNVICDRSIQQQLKDDGSIARVFYAKYLRHIAMTGKIAPLTTSIACLNEAIAGGNTWKGIEADFEELMMGYLKTVSQERVLEEFPELMLDLDIDLSQQALDDNNILTQPLLRAFMVRVIGSRSHQELQLYYSRYFPSIAGK